MSWTAKYFSYDEMKCKCGCEQAPMDQGFMNLLDDLRDAWGKPMTISSGYRCPNHPIEAKKAKAGAHASGKAADIAIEREEAHTMLRLVSLMEFSGIGVQQKGSGRFIHVDTMTSDDGFPRPTIWSY